MGNILNTNIGVVRNDWVEKFMNIVVGKDKFKLSSYSENIYGGQQHFVQITLTGNPTTIEEGDILLQLKSGMTLLEHVNLYCKFHPDYWNEVLEEHNTIKGEVY